MILKIPTMILKIVIVTLKIVSRGGRMTMHSMAFLLKGFLDVRYDCSLYPYDAYGL